MTVTWTDTGLAFVLKTEGKLDVTRSNPEKEIEMTDQTNDPLDALADAEANEARLKQICDDILHRAMQDCVDQGASVPMILDRQFTLAGGQATSTIGKDRAAAAQRLMADNIEAGLFDQVIGPKRHLT